MNGARGARGVTDAQPAVGEENASTSDAHASGDAHHAVSDAHHAVSDAHASGASPNRSAGTPRNATTPTTPTLAGDEPVLSPANEDYLEAIYTLGGQNGQVRSTDLASHLDVSKASVSNAVAVLKQGGFVEQPYYGDISLTEKGTTYAAAILRRHLVLYHFLIDVLGVEPALAFDEACKLEHSISATTLERLAEHLKDETGISVGEIPRAVEGLPDAEQNKG